MRWLKGVIVYVLFQCLHNFSLSLFVFSFSLLSATYEVVLFPPVSDPTDFYGMGYDGMGLASSGFLIASEYAADFNGAESYALTFNQAGLYKYVCSIHDDTQMVGFVEVLPSDNNGGGNNPPPGPGQDLPSNTVNVNFAGVFNGLLV